MQCILFLTEVHTYCWVSVNFSNNYGLLWELPCGPSGMPLRSPELPAPEVSPVWATGALLLGWRWLLGMRIGGAGFGHAHKWDWLLGMRSFLWRAGWGRGLLASQGLSVGDWLQGLRRFRTTG